MGANGIYGLSGSGLDIESLVKMGMMNKQNQYDKMYQQEVKQTWLKEAYNDVYTDIADFQKAVSTYKMQSNMNAMNATANNSNSVSVSANGAAVAMNHQVAVKSVATNAYLMTQNGDKVQRNKADSQSSNYLRDVMYSKYETGKGADGAKEYQVNGDGVWHKGSDIAVSITIQDSVTGKPRTLKYTYDQILSDDSKKTLNDFASDFANTGSNVHGSYDTANDTFVLYNQATGADNMVGLSANTEDAKTLLNNLHLAEFDGNTNTLGSTLTFAKTNRAEGVVDQLTGKSIAAHDTAAGGTQKSVLGLSAEVAKADGKYTMTIKNGEEVVDTLTADSLTALNDLIKSKDAFSLKLSSNTTSKVTGEDTTTSSSTVTFKYSDLLGEVTSSTVDGTETLSVAYKSTKDVLDNVSNKLNTISSGGKFADITVGYDDAADSFTLTTTRQDSSITLLAGDAGAARNAVVRNIGVAHTDYAKTGTNAQVRIDGRDYDLDSNKKTIAGVTYNFLAPSAKDEAGNMITTQVSVTQDTSKIVEHVKNFVDAYNALLEKMNKRLTEQKYADYKPLTKRQEEEMKEDQIKKWEEKAKSGLLYNDKNVRSLVSAMRETIYTPVKSVNSKYNSLSAIGITTVSTAGKIELDETKLNKALAADPDCVYQLFAPEQDSSYDMETGITKKIDSGKKKDDFQHTGVASRLYNVMTDYTKVIASYAGTSKETDDQSYLGKMITNMQTKMNNYKTQMTAYEKLLYKKYDAMEVALSKLGTQLSYITG